MNIVIVGENYAEVKELAIQIERIDPAFHSEIIRNIEDTAKVLSNGRPVDLIFCSIHTASKSIIKLLQAIKEYVPWVLVVLLATDYSLVEECSEYIWRFEIRPLSPSKLKHILTRANSILTPQLIVLPSSNSHNRFLLNINYIMYFEIFDKTGVVHTTEDKAYQFKAPLTKIEAELASGVFYRPHKSFLVNIHYIKYITDTEIYLIDNVRIPLSRNRKNTLFKLLSNNANIIFT